MYLFFTHDLYTFDSFFSLLRHLGIDFCDILDNARGYDDVLICKFLVEIDLFVPEY